MSTSTPTQVHSPGRVAPTVQGAPLIGNMRDVQRDLLGFTLRVARQYGDVAQYGAGLWSAYLISHPDGVRQVLQENHRNYSKETFFFDVVRTVGRNGLLTSEGAFWLHQRRLVQPVFSRQRLAVFGPPTTGATLAMLEGWQAVARSGQPLDVSQEMTRLTMTVVLRALFSTDIGDRAEPLSAALTTALEQISYRITNPFYPPQLPTARNRRFRAALQTLDEFVYSIIRDRRSRDTDTTDLLSMLLEARDEETGAGMSDNQLRDEVLTLFAAGHDTTAYTLAWGWYLLAQHPAVAERLRAELAAVLAGRVPTVADLPALPYTRMVLDEVMRLYPAAWITSRKALAADEIGGYHIPAGAYVVVSPYVTQRHPTFWEDPERFDPERFAPEQAAGRPRFAYFPFGGGPRQCVGQYFALMEAQLILATVAQRYRLELVPGHPVVAQPSVTLRPRYGIQMTVHPL